MIYTAPAAFTTAVYTASFNVFRHLSSTIEQVLCAAPLDFLAPSDFASSIMVFHLECWPIVILFQ